MGSKGPFFYHPVHPPIPYGGKMIIQVSIPGSDMEILIAEVGEYL